MHRRKKLSPNVLNASCSGKHRVRARMLREDTVHWYTRPSDWPIPAGHASETRGEKKQINGKATSATRSWYNNTQLDIYSSTESTEHAPNVSGSRLHQSMKFVEAAHTQLASGNSSYEAMYNFRKILRYTSIAV